MMKVRMSDGAVFDVVDSRDLVRQLRRASRDKRKNERAFMRAAAARSGIQFGARIRCSTFRKFVADLLEAGIIERVK